VPLSSCIRATISCFAGRRVNVLHTPALVARNAVPSRSEGPHPLAAIPEVRNFQSPSPATLSPRRQVAEQWAPFRLRSSYYPPISKQPTFNLQRTLPMAEFLRNTWHFTGISNSWMQSSSTKQPISGAPSKGKQIPWARPLVLRVSEQAKAHPHATGVLKILRPQF
jgi:hypothetical protein